LSFDDLIKEVKGVSFVTVRVESDGYFEAVIWNTELKSLTEKLDKYFGSPTWPSKNKLPSHAEETIKNFGGINPGQTLYFWNEDGAAIFAMLWPWQDEKHTTVKVVKI